MDDAPGHQRVSIRIHSELPSTRSRLRLRLRVWREAQNYGYPGETHCVEFAMAITIVERLIGSIRRECLDHIIVLNQTHFRRLLDSQPSTPNPREVWGCYERRPATGPTRRRGAAPRGKKRMPGWKTSE